jgi:Icc-related predicted phosphoesterase
MVFGALGDVHGAFEDARRIVARHAEIPFWLCVGDIASETGAYEPLGAPVYWIHGNNDNFDAIASGGLPAELHHIDNGTMVEIAGPEGPADDRDVGGVEIAGPEGSRDDRPGEGPADDRPVGRVFRPGVLRVAGLGGTFAPTWYETPAHDLPHPKKGSAKATELADKRRHFVRDEVERAALLRGIDVLLTHEAPKPFRAFPGGGPDAGKAQINEVLRAMRPRLHLFGHHHRYSDQSAEGVRSIGLDLVSRSYALIRVPDFQVQRLER